MKLLLIGPNGLKNIKEKEREANTTVRIDNGLIL
jgi:hypothetical protein